MAQAGDAMPTTVAAATTATTAVRRRAKAGMRTPITPRSPVNFQPALEGSPRSRGAPIRLPAHLGMAAAVRALLPGGDHVLAAKILSLAGRGFLPLRARRRALGLEHAPPCRMLVDR